MPAAALSLTLLAAAGLAANRTHYGDPNTHPLAPCLPDEVKAKINGLDGDLCIPPCDSGGGCPADKPAGVTAAPTCALTDASSGAKYCALVCTPGGAGEEEGGGGRALASPLDAQCGAKASCKKGQASSGLCTYDDGPKPPASAHWAPVDSPTFQEQSVCLSVGFEQDGLTGFAGAGSNGVGAQIIKSTDGGKTWAPTPGQNVSFNIFLIAKTKSPTSAVVSGAIAQEHTTDGETFVGGGPVLCPAQDVGIIPGSEDYGLVAQCAKGQGIYRSTDGGTYEAVSIPEHVLNSTFELVRYAAFPTADTWYVAAGTFPNTNSGGAAAAAAAARKGARRVTQRLTVDAQSFTLADPADDAHGEDDGPVNCSEDVENCFAGAIVKTTDGGKTWTKVWENVNKGDNIYNNGIHCSSAEHCVAVVEGDTARILVTRDGGHTWTETMHDTDSASSLTAVHMFDEKEGWVSGGHMAQLDFEGRYFHTLDGGDTWTKEAIKGLYIFSFDMVSRHSGYSVALTASSGVQLLKYRDNSTDAAVGANSGRVLLDWA